MNLTLETAWAAEARTDGATRQTPLLDALRMNNLTLLGCEARTWQIVAVLPTMEAAMSHNLDFKRAWKSRNAVVAPNNRVSDPQPAQETP
jgi:hypothetical protein